MFTDEFKKYIFIGISIILVISMIVGSKSLLGKVSKDTIYNITLPFQKAFVSVNGWFEKSGERIKSTNQTKEENEQLKRQLEELTLQNNTYEVYKKQNEELKELLKLKDSDPYTEMIAARVIGVDPTNSTKVIIIDKGQKDNIQKDMIVIHTNGLVGRVLEVGDNYSKIITLTDDRMTVGVSVERTSEKLVLVGNNVSQKGTCKIENMDVSTDLLEDDMIYTSNVSMLYPEGIKVGKIKNISVARDGLTKNAIVKPEVDVNKIEYVMIIKNKEMLEEDIEKVFSEYNTATLY